ncbi:MAG: OmcA/MtrC family decaheme c-type cytochrome [Ectothiorhodospira sp.]
MNTRHRPIRNPYPHRGAAAWALYLSTLVLAGCLPSDDGFDEDTAGGGQETPNAEAPADELGLSITSAAINEGGHPVVEFTLLDAEGTPITDLTSARFTFAKLAPRSRYGDGYDWLNYITRERPVASEGWELATTDANPEGEPMFGNAIQGDAENDGNLEHLGNGEYRYTYALDVNEANRTLSGNDVGELWRCVEEGSHEAHAFSEDLGRDQRCTWADGTTLPRGVTLEGSGDTLTYTVEYNPQWTHRVGMQVDGDLPAANAWFDFIPETGEQPEHGVDATRDIVALESCNTCHDDTLEMHGGRRVEPNYCVTCHNPGSVDPVSGRSIDFKQMIHKIHRGETLPSVQAGVPYFIRDTDFSRLRFPQAVHENGGIEPAGDYESQGVTAEGDPIPRQASYGVGTCVKCHMGEESQNALVTLAGGEESLEALQLAEVTPDGDNWYQEEDRSIEVCASCHDNVFWYGDIDGGFGFTGDASSGWNRSREDETLPARLAMRFGASTAGPRDDWRTGHRTGYDADSGVWGGEDGTLAGATGDNLFSTGDGCGGCHNQSPAEDIQGIGLRGIGESGMDRVRLPRVHLSFLRAGLRQDQLRVEYGLQGATLDRDAGTIDFRIRVRDDGNNAPLIHDDNARFQLGFVVGWREEGFADYTHSTSESWPGRPVELACDADCWSSGGDGDAIQIDEPDGNGYYPVTLSLPDPALADLPEAGVGSVAVQNEVVPLDPDPSGTVDSVWDDPRTPVVNALHRTTSFAIGNAVAEPRRQVVDVEETCRSCHIRFAKHGPNRRNNPELCVLCHNPNNTDISSDPALPFIQFGRVGQEGIYDGKYEESLDFKRLVHHIHRARMGNEGIQLRDVVFGGPLADWDGEAHFPGSVGNCRTCHVEESYELPLEEGVIGSTRRSFDWDFGDFTNAGTAQFGADNTLYNLEQHEKFSPITSVCTSCHTDESWREEHILQRGGSLQAHIDDLDPMGEGCMDCHGPGGEADISRVHDIRER